MNNLRKSFAVATALVVGGVLFGAATSSQAQEKEVTLLGLFPFTGPYADTGPLMDAATKIALEEVNYQVAGYKIKYVTRDSETKAGAATRRVEEAIASEGVDFVIGPWAGGVGVAVSEVAKNRKFLHYYSGGNDLISGKRCHRYAFQWAAAPWTAVNAVLGAFKKQHPEAKKIYLFIVDHVFGWGQQAYVESLAPNYGLEVVGVDRHPLGHREFSPFITKAMSTNPDAIYMVNFGLDAISAARQIYNFGFTPKKTVIMSWSAGFEEMVQLSPEGRENMIVGTNFYYQIDTPVAIDFVKKYKAQSKDNQPPGYAPGAAYAMTRKVLAGIRKAGSGKVQDVVKALEGYKGEDLVGPFHVEAHNHQTIRPYYVLKAKKKNEMKHDFDFATIIDVNSTPQPSAINECKDIGKL